MSSSSAAAETAARLTHVHVAFEGREALCGVEAEIHAGSLTVIAGPNGAGKSTLLEVLAGTRVPTSGSRRVSGSVAFVPQRASIPPRLPVSVKDVVSVGTWGRLGFWRRMDSTARELVDRSLERLDIHGLARHPFTSLSGGQQQRALLAQGLAREADVLLLDEPTTGLDAASSLRIRAVLREEAARGVAVVCVSHDAAVIGDADRVISLSEGRVAAG
ncbi:MULTISPECIES: zinc ABC transporter ATP-binding protein AztA [unclassified Microbacterium]|uniref:zinc ABC transporter ATP-binding protein AztA n=1 Tax=unclassified Microbacterium TaxID=2609290 RepID=UPI000EAAB240|nr:MULTISPECIES: zinc ABC transporter ATP-binding protein AztA [unclassified Microbacterium]MBT2484700.1 metal ABC transporter ATP-binding protein [Microbacterium sp. ISL-108]RKN67584.1 metal ABC transporter ATP-binding protein [Microbacterium sp. CGR2]